VAIYDLAVTLLSDDEFSAQKRVIDALRLRGAVSPATARPFDDFNVATDSAWNRLVIQGRVREGLPGHFYLFERPPSNKQRIIKMLVFYVIILLIPIVLILLNGKGH